MRTFARVLGILVLIGLGPFALLALYSSPSVWGFAYVACLIAATIGLISLPTRKRRGVTRVAVAALVTIAIVRMLLPDRAVALRTTNGGSRPIDRVLDERDVGLMGARVLQLTGTMPDPDVPVVFDAMKDGYDRMSADAGFVPSPFAATYLGLESPDASDVIRMGPESSDTVVIFLHGFAGSFTLPCWQVGQTVRALGMRTVCPATSWRGDWWTADGEKTLRGVVRIEKDRGAKTLILAGLSNGGIGASRLAPRFPGTFAGLVLISGVASDAPAPNIPTLVFQGRSDAMVRTPAVRAWAKNANATYEEVDAAHFALLVKHEESEKILRTWLARFTPRRA